MHIITFKYVFLIQINLDVNIFNKIYEIKILLLGFILLVINSIEKLFLKLLLKFVVEL